MDRDDKFTSRNILRLAEKHIKRYEGMLKIAQRGGLGASTIRVGETAKLLDIWKGIQDVQGVIRDMTLEQYHEVEDAVEDDEMFGGA